MVGQKESTPLPVQGLFLKGVNSKTRCEYLGSHVDLPREQYITKLKEKWTGYTRQLLHSMYELISFLGVWHPSLSVIPIFRIIIQVWGFREFSSHREFNISQMPLPMEPHCICKVSSPTVYISLDFCEYSWWNNFINAFLYLGYSFSTIKWWRDSFHKQIPLAFFHGCPLWSVFAL